MTREEEIKAAIVVTPEMHGASPAMHHASQQAGMQLYNFADFIQSLDPRLERDEATLLVAAFLENLPGLCNQSPGVIKCLKQNAEMLIARRTNEKT